MAVAAVQWYDSHANVADLLRDLEQRGEIWNVDQAVAVAEKPWHWEIEHQRMLKERDALEVPA